MVLDEYGGMSGIVTIKDLIEELVGDLEDDVIEEDPEEEITELESGLWTVGGGALLEDLSPIVGVTLESEEYDTLNGLVFHHLGISPEEGDELELDKVHIRVTEIRNFQVKTALVRKKEGNEA